MIESNLADQFMQLKATQAALSKQEDELKAKLLALGDPLIEGLIARVTIADQAGRTSFDADLLAKYVPAATIALCKKTGKASKRFEVKAKTADKRFEQRVA